eukprot:SAG31_NODE_41725_length_274_cov_2.251429_1_plen_49_part_10
MRTVTLERWLYVPIHRAMQSRQIVLVNGENTGRARPTVVVERRRVLTR